MQNKIDNDYNLLQDLFDWIWYKLFPDNKPKTTKEELQELFPTLPKEVKYKLPSKEDKLKLMGYSIDDDYLVSMFDSTYENSKMIKSMKITSKGFSHYTKVLSEEAIDNLVKIVDLKIKEAFKEISKGNFSIDPKVIANENIGCRFCSYQDLCFKTGKDLVYLEEKNDLTYLEGDDNNATLD